MRFITGSLLRAFDLRILTTMTCTAAFLAVFAASMLAQSPPDVNPVKVPANYRIGVGDVLTVRVAKQDLLSIDGARVKNDGTIDLPMLKAPVRAACMTEVELAEEIAQHYTKYLLNPQVYVAVKEFRSNPVAFIGAVNEPGTFDVQRPTRLLELLTFVKGPSPRAGKSIQIIRSNETFLCGQDEASGNPGPSQEILSIPLERTLVGDSSANPFVQAGDIITIAEAEAPDEAYIIGNVKNPRTITLNEPVTVSKAVAMAGGASNGAKTKKIEITRQDPETLAIAKTIVNLEAIEKGEQADIVLQANDIVDIPGPKPSTFEKIFRAVLPIARVPILF